MLKKHKTIQRKYVPSIRVIELEKEVRNLHLKLAGKDNRITILEQHIQDLKILVAELQRMLFKKKKPKKGSKDRDDDFTDQFSNRRALKKRPKWSFRRSKPKLEEVTKQEEHTLDQCTHCNGPLEKLGTRTIYIENIPEVKKEITKRIIHQYICCDCQKRQSAIPLPRGHDVILGGRVKSLVLYHTYILKSSFRDIVRTLKDVHAITISKGEIQYIQEQAAMRLKKTYNGIHEELLNQESLNMDETGWKVGGIQNYLWDMCSPTSDATLFHIGTRGKGNAEKLLKEFDGCVTTDCYAGYKNLENIDHQICWVHILRNARDLAYADQLSKDQQESAQDLYKGLCLIYQKIKNALDKPYDEKRRKRQVYRLRKELRSINQIQEYDQAKKLKNLKKRTQEYEQELFTCLKYKTALPENNLAERSLRHVVLKRKQCFGSQTLKGARIFAINCTVLLTLWKRFPDTFFKELQPLLAY